MAGSWVKLSDALVGSDVVTPFRPRSSAAFPASASEILSGIPDLAYLRAFSAVRRHLSFSLAAQELGMGQPAVSKQVQALEAMLHVRLFERTKPRLHMTDEGQRLARAIEYHMGAFGQSLGDVRSGEQPITIFAEDSGLAAAVAPQFAAFQRRSPGRVSVVRQEDRADLVIGRSPGLMPNGEDIFLFADEWVVASGSNWPRARDLSRSEVALETLLAQTAEDALLWQWFLGTTRAPEVRVLTPTAYEHAMRNGHGVGLINAPLHQKALRLEHLVQVGRDRLWTGDGVWATLRNTARHWDRGWMLAAHLQRRFAAPLENGKLAV